MTPVPARSRAVPFDSVVCGIDGSPEALEAARQGCRIAPGVPVTLVCAVDTLAEPTLAPEIPQLAHLMRDHAHAAVAEALDHLGTVGAGHALEVAIEEGHVVDVLRYVVADASHALLTLGTRAEAIPDGARPGPAGASYRERTVLQVVRNVAGSVLVGRLPSDPPRFPASIAVGVDGSNPALEAHAVAEAIAERTGARLRYVVGLGGKGADLEALRAALPDIPLGAIDRRHPADALLAAAADVDLVVVGRRGLHGLRAALGSVSERLVARSSASVLVVHRP